MKIVLCRETNLSKAPEGFLIASQRLRKIDAVGAVEQGSPQDL
jgi:hypothetical protein